MTHKRTGRWIRTLWGLIAAALIVPVMPAASAAEGSIEKIGVLKADPPKDTQENSLAGVLILNPTARRGFQLFTMEFETAMKIRVLDLDTYKTLGEVTVKRNIKGPGLRSLPAQYPYALDEERNILYLPYAGDASDVDGVVAIDGNTMKVVDTFERLSSSDPTAALKVNPDAVSDDNDLTDVVTPCTASACQPSVPGAKPFALGMDLVPPFLTGGNPKILMLFGEPNAWPLELNSNVIHVVQWDALTGRQDFIYQVRACTSRSMPNTPSSSYPMAIFQARLGSGIYLGCNAAGGTAQVVRITLDGNGKPTAEETFPGPTNVSDILADKEDDRLLFRVSNEEGESYWVFNGSASSYSGVVGTAIQPVATGAGIDNATGRLYVLTPPQSVGNQRSPGGLLLSDIRRNPAPQALVFPEFANDGFSEIAVDSNAPNGERRIFVRPAGKPDYLILRDDVPVTTDPPLTDLDRFTTDVEEKEGVTGANFTGTGHAYGVRALLVGGMEGMPPGGPDLSSIRVGRFVPRMLGSPCYGGDRAVVVGSVQEAQLSNNISNAAATSAETEAGTITDARQPTQRCYPKPRIEGGAGESDPFTPLYPLLPDKEYPRPLDGDTDTDGLSDVDETAGSDWPFGIAQCASNDAAKQSTKPKPLDRGDSVPKDVKGAEVELKGFNAETRCSLPKADVFALAQAGPFEQTALPTKDVPKIDYPKEAQYKPQPKEIGFIRVGETASMSHVRKIKGLGLVSESFAYVRNVNLGDRIFIDAAFTYARARAAGRPGTAATDFVRRICGVRIPELGIHVDVIDQDVAPVAVGDPLNETGRSVFPNGVDLPGIGDSLPSEIDLPDTGILPPGIGIPRDSIPRHIDPPSQPIGDVDPLNPDSEDQQITDRQVNNLCGDPGVQQAGSQPVIDAMNRILGARGRVSAPEPDTELRQGSTGGYLASIQKDRLQQIGARSVQNDDSSQVPALEIVLFNDDPTKGRGRQVYQLAGVDASVTYGIYLLNPESDDFDLPDELVDITDDEGIIPPPIDPRPVDGVNGGEAPRGPLGPLKILYDGVTFLLRSPLDALLAAAVWALLFSPVQMMTRRRALRLAA